MGRAESMNIYVKLGKVKHEPPGRGLDRFERFDADEEIRRVTRLYIAGPMTGYPDWNYPAFHATEDLLREFGYEDIVNPAKLSSIDEPRSVCMRKAIEGLITCNTIVLLPFWFDSKGASLEFVIAKELGMKMAYANKKGLVYV